MSHEPRRTASAPPRGVSSSAGIAADADLPAIYDALLAAYGHRAWWPGRSRFEIIVGAVLTQNTNWGNVERALVALRGAGLLEPRSMAAATDAALGAAIRASGYYRQKTRKLRAFLELLDASYAGSLTRMARRPMEVLRAELLSVWGIGPETADSILLYAFGRPVFVVDAYTHRLLRRHGLHPGGGYEEVRAFFERRLRGREDLFNDFHAQIVRVGQLHCRTAPRCASCPLERFLPPSGPKREEPAGARRGPVRRRTKAPRAKRTP